MSQMSQMETDAGTGGDAGSFDAGGNESASFAQNMTIESAGAAQEHTGSMLAAARNGQAGQGYQGGNAPAASPMQAVPESYQLSVPEGLGLEDSDLTTIQSDMRGMGLSNEQANGVLSMAAKNQQAALERYATQVEGWKTATRSDPEIGGAQLDTTVRYAMSALNSFDTDGRVLEMLTQSGYANNPDVIRLLSRMGKAMGEDMAVTGRGRGNDVPLHERLYGASAQ